MVELKQQRNVIKQVVENNFDYSCAKFREKSGGLNWNQLEEAMWALQYSHIIDDKQVNDIYCNTGVGLWVEQLAKWGRAR